jgi:hypothetical protein
MTGNAPPAVDLVEGETLAAVAALWRKTGRELRARFGGSSMEPALPPGTEVVLRCGETGAPGEVVAFLAGGRLVLHRVVARAADGSWTLTRGDARVLPDVPIRDPDAIVGRVTGCLRAGTVEDVPPARDTVLKHWVVGTLGAVMDASPPVGAAALRTLHTLSRLLRLLPAVMGRRNKS